MKKTIPLLLFLLISVCSFASKPKTILNPSYEVRNTGLYEVAKVVLNDTSTLVYIHITFLPNWWVLFNQDDVSIKDPISGEVFFVKGIAGAEFGKRLWMPASGDSTIAFVFPKLDKSIKKIDFSTSSEEADGETIFGISLDEKRRNLTIKNVPDDVANWLETKIANATQTPIDNYESSRFFNPDTAHLVGYIKGYDPRLNLKTGIIYSDNLITREDYPTVIRVYPDGRFEANFILVHPIYSYFVLNDAILRFYIEPGQTLSITLDWDEFLMADRIRNIRYKLKNIIYGGALATINTELEKYPQEQFDYKAYQKKVVTLAPDDFKADLLSTQSENNTKLEVYAKNNPLTANAYTLLKNDILLKTATNLLDFVDDRAYKVRSKKDTSNSIIKLPIPKDYYNFLKEMPLNSNSLVVVDEYSTFINRFEYCSPFSLKVKLKTQGTDQYKEYGYWLELWKLRDSVIQNAFGLPMNLTYEIAKIRSLNYGFKNMSKESAYEYWDSLKMSITNPFLANTGTEMLQKIFPENVISSYELPKGIATDIFKKIVDPFKGKILFIDFWATTCGPCVGGIKRMKETREKYKDNPDFDFIFITDERSSPLEAYNKMVKEQELKNTFRISKDDYYYLRQLFKFNGIPHYIAIDKKGNVITDDFEMSNFEHELIKILSNK